MRKFFSLPIIIVILLVLYVVDYGTGFTDTRFLFYDHDVWKPFYSGIYHEGTDLDAGRYNIIFRGGAMNGGSVSVYRNTSKGVAKDVMWVRNKDKIFSFRLEEGGWIEFNIDTSKDMLIQKVD